MFSVFDCIVCLFVYSVVYWDDNDWWQETGVLTLCWQCLHWCPLVSTLGPGPCRHQHQYYDTCSCHSSLVLILFNTYIKRTYIIFINTGVECCIQHFNELQVSYCISSFMKMAFSLLHLVLVWRRLSELMNRGDCEDDCHVSWVMTPAPFFSSQTRGTSAEHILNSRIRNLSSCRGRGKNFL